LPAPSASHGSSSIPCPLCGEPATLIDRHPGVEWIAIEGCACGGYFVWADLLAVRRLKSLPSHERATLQARIVELRAMVRRAWLTTGNGRIDGPLVVRAERPD